MPGRVWWRWLAVVCVALALAWAGQVLLGPVSVHAAAEGAAVHHQAVEGHGAAGEAGGHEEAEPMVSHQQLMNFIWHCLNFALLIVILVKFLKQPITDAIKGREQQIAAAFDELEATRAEAERKYAEYERKLANLEQEAQRIRNSFIEQGKAEKERIIAQAQEAAERIKAQAELFIQQELVKAKRELQREMADMAVGMAEELIRKNITEEDHKKLIEDYLSKVEAES